MISVALGHERRRFPPTHENDYEFFFGRAKIFYQKERKTRWCLVSPFISDFGNKTHNQPMASSFSLSQDGVVDDYDNDDVVDDYDNDNEQFEKKTNHNDVMNNTPPLHQCSFP